MMDMVADEPREHDARDVFIRSHLKIKILVQDQGGAEF